MKGSYFKRVKISAREAAASKWATITNAKWLQNKIQQIYFRVSRSVGRLALELKALAEFSYVSPEGQWEGLGNINLIDSLNSYLINYPVVYRHFKVVLGEQRYALCDFSPLYAPVKLYDLIANWLRNIVLRFVLE